MLRCAATVMLRCAAHEHRSERLTKHDAHSAQRVKFCACLHEQQLEGAREPSVGTAPPGEGGARLGNDASSDQRGALARRLPFLFESDHG